MDLYSGVFIIGISILAPEIWGAYIWGGGGGWAVEVYSRYQARKSEQFDRKLQFLQLYCCLLRSCNR